MLNKPLFAGLAALLLLAGCPSQDKKKSIEKANKGVQMLRQKSYDGAESLLVDAANTFRDNHTAWYNLGLARDGLKKFGDAAEAYAQAAKVSSKQPMYHMQHGIASYNGLIEDVRKRTARTTGQEVAQVNVEEIDLTSANFDPAIQSLEAALKLNDKLFRAHYFLGRIYRHQDKVAEAAQAFTRTIQANPRFAVAYIALGELYRRWDYLDEAITVLQQGKANVSQDRDAPTLLLSLGMAYSDKRDYAKAAEEFSAAIGLDRNLHAAIYQRGLAYYRLNDYKKALADLEEYQKVGKDAQTKGIAATTVLDIKAKTL